MALLSLEKTTDVLHTLSYTGAADQLAYTDAVGHQAAFVTRTILDLDLMAISTHIATSIVASLR
jgi:hypothetical protein